MHSHAVALSSELVQHWWAVQLLKLLSSWYRLNSANILHIFCLLPKPVHLAHETFLWASDWLWPKRKVPKLCLPMQSTLIPSVAAKVTICLSNAFGCTQKIITFQSKKIKVFAFGYEASSPRPVTMWDLSSWSGIWISESLLETPYPIP